MVFVIIIGILLLPILIVLSPVLLVVYFVKKRAKKRHYAQKWEQKIKELSAKQFATPYTEPVNPVPDAIFAERIGEFTCLQFWSCNDHSGGITMRELVASQHPEKKAQVLAFLQEHPITELLNGERDDGSHDSNRWKIRFIFEESYLNRTICGYGRTELTAPYLFQMCKQLPEILSKDEQEEERLLKIRAKIDLQNCLAELQSKNEQ